MKTRTTKESHGNQGRNAMLQTRTVQLEAVFRLFEYDAKKKELYNQDKTIRHPIKVC